MGKHKKKLIALAVFAALSIAAIPFSPQVEYGLSKMLNLNGEFTKLIFEGNRVFTADDIGGGGGSSFDDGGTMTGRLEITPAGTQIATAGLKIGDGVTGGINLGSLVLYSLSDGLLYSPPFYLSGSGGKSYLRNDSDGQLATVFDSLNIGAIPAGTNTGSAQDYYGYFNPAQYKRYLRTMAWIADNGSATGKASFGIAVMDDGVQPSGTSSCQFVVNEDGVKVIGNGTVTGNLAVTGVISGDGSSITGVIADGLSGTNLTGTGSIKLETTTPGKNITFTTALGTGGVYVDNGTASFKVVPTQYFYYPDLYATTTTNATERNFFSIVVPPKVMGPNGQMEIYCLRSNGTTSATTPFRIAIYDGVGTQTLFYLSNQSTSFVTVSQTYLFENCGSTILQYSYGSTTTGHGAVNSATVVPGTYTVNTNNTCTVTFSGAGTASVTLYKTLIKTIYLE